MVLSALRIRVWVSMNSLDLSLCKRFDWAAPVTSSDLLFALGSQIDLPVLSTKATSKPFKADFAPVHSLSIKPVHLF